jgi:hypothetical protein
VEKYGRPGQATDSMAHALSMLDDYENAPQCYVIRTVHYLSCSVGGSTYNGRNMPQRT